MTVSKGFKFLDVTNLAKISLKCIVEIILGANAPVLAVATDELVCLGMEKVAKNASEERALKQTIDKVCNQEVLGPDSEFIPLISSAVEICIENLNLFQHPYDATGLATKLSNDYIDRYNSQLEEAVIAQLKRHLSRVLESVIYQLQIQVETDPAFQVKWKSVIDERVTSIEQMCVKQQRQIADHESRISAQEAKDYRVQNVAELSDVYRDKWQDALFLDENIPLKCVYQLPHYNDGFCDLHDRLQNVLNLCNDINKRMLVVLGHPGGGKSSLITYLLNNCIIEAGRTIRVCRFSGFDGINWNNNPENLPQLMLNQLGLAKKDLSNSVLILDGLDEVDMHRGHAEFLAHVFKQWAKAASISRFSLIVTCRINRIDHLDELQPPYIVLSPLDQDQIEEFARAYWFAGHVPVEPEDTLLEKLICPGTDLHNVMGIPLILYMTLALDVDVTGSLHLGDVYDQIFSLKSNNSIYFRGKYDSKHPVTAAEAEKIHIFSKKVATKMWEDNPSDATLSKPCVEIIANEVAGPGEESLRKLLIGQYFMEGQEGQELLFVHRSMFEYFVALSIFDLIEALVAEKKKPEQLFSGAEMATDENLLVPVADLLGLQSLAEFPDIQGYLCHMLQRANTTTKKIWWKDLLNQFVQYGLSDFVINRRTGGIAGIGEEVNRFYNLLWLTKMQYVLAKEQPPFRIFDGEDSCMYFRIPTMVKRDLGNLVLSHANLCGVDFSDVDFNGSDLSYTTLGSAELSNANLRVGNLRGSKMINAVLETADLERANLSGADLRCANLSGANLAYADLSNADLSGASLCSANLTGAKFHNTKLMGTEFSGAVLVDVDFKNADLSDAVLSDMDLQGVKFLGSALLNAQLINAHVCNATFIECDLSGAILDKADMTNSKVEATLMKNVSMKDAFLKNCRFKDVSLSMSDLSNSVFNGAVMHHANLEGADLSNAEFQRAKLNHVNFRGAELIHTNFQGAKLLKTNITYGGLDKALFAETDLSKWDIEWVSSDDSADLLENNSVAFEEVFDDIWDDISGFDPYKLYNSRINDQYE